jgi:hypothetical protein
LSSIVKPEELVDIVEMTPLTLQDRRIYNLLIGRAWNQIFGRETHQISAAKLTQYVNSHNQDIAASLRRLMAAIVQVKIRSPQREEWEIRQIALLGSNKINRRQGQISYSFPPELVRIIRHTQIFARLHTKVMFELSSKYSLALYEFLQRRRHLKHIHAEVLTVSEVRGLLGVGADKLKSFGHLHHKAIKPATREVSFLTDYEITAEPIRTGRTVTHVKFAWSKKTDIGAQIAAVEEWERSPVGRKARLEGRVETAEMDADVAPLPYRDDGGRLPDGSEEKKRAPSSPSRRPFLLSASIIEKAKSIAQQAKTGWDIYAIEQQFYDYAQQKGMPDNPEGAFLNFVRKKVKSPPGGYWAGVK